MLNEAVPYGEEFQVNTYTNGNQASPSITGLNDGGFVVTWISDQQDGSDEGVFGQSYAADGSTIGDEFQINTLTTDDQTSPSVTGLSDGGFVVTWQSSDQDGNRFGIFGQSYAANGSTTGDEFQINTNSDGDQNSPSVTGLSDGGFMVTWQSRGQDGSGQGVFGQRYTSDGNATGDEFQVNTYSDNDQTSPSVAGLSDGGFVVTWTSEQDGNETRVFGQSYAADASTTGGEFQVNTSTTGNQSLPSVTGLRDGGFVVTWSSEQNGTFSGIYGQSYAANGNAIGEEFQINTYSTINMSSASVTGLGNGGFVVMSRASGDIFGQYYAADGATIGEEFQVNTDTTSYQGSPSVAAVSNGIFVVTWQSRGDDGSGLGVFGQSFIVNDAPKGDVVINGAVVQGRTLSADASGVTDVDGLGLFSYQWLRNGIEISGATTASYISGQDDVDATISVRASYTDDYGFDESITSRITVSVVNINDAPDGNVAIGGVAQQGQLLTADTSGVTDADGIDATTVTYQWLRDGVVITGSTADSYTLTQADVGGEMSVVHTYTDDFGAEENLISAVTAPVRNINDAPTGSVVIDGTATQGQTLTADISDVTDADGIDASTITYQWLRDGIKITGATNVGYDLIQADVGSEISLVITYTDNFGFDETVVSDETDLVRNINDAPAGPVVIDGMATQGQTLTADISNVTDADGIDASTITYQWLRDGIEITGATNVGYDLIQADVESEISLVVIYTDNFGFDETVVSDETDLVRNINDAPAGSVVIDGTATQGQTLTADISDVTDADGIDASTITYQWLRNGVVLSGAAKSTYLLSSSDVGGEISVSISYTDNFGRDEATKSQTTSAVITPETNFETDGPNVLTGTKFDDVISGLKGNDNIVGLDANDFLRGNQGNDTLLGRAGNDQLFGGNGKDVLHGQKGQDELRGGNNNDQLFGGAGNDLLFGGQHDDLMDGGQDNDLMDGGQGSDLMDGGLGTDTVSYVNSATAVKANLRTAKGTGGDAQGDRLYNIENIDGSDYADKLLGNIDHNSISGGSGNDWIKGREGNDTLFGNKGRDEIYGGKGNDQLNGGNGKDVLNGGSGNDKLSGGGGADTFVFSSGADVVADFDALNDGEKIDVSAMSEINDFDDLVEGGYLRKAGTSVIIDAFEGDTMKLLNVNPFDLNADDFLF